MNNLEQIPYYSIFHMVSVEVNLYFVVFLVFVVFVVFVVGLIAGLDSGDTLAHASGGVMLLVLFVIEWGYYTFFEVLWSGRTPGKRALRLRVVTEGGQLEWGPPWSSLTSFQTRSARGAIWARPIWNARLRRIPIIRLKLNGIRSS